MRRAIISVSNPAYYNQTKYLFGALRRDGGWTGDLVLLANGMSKQQVFNFARKGICVFTITEMPFSWAKIMVFQENLGKVWDELLYLDQDFVFRGNVAEIFNQEGAFLADRECCNIGEQFNLSVENEVTKELKELVDINLPSFGAGGMLWRTNAIPFTIFDLDKLRRRFASINVINGISDGSADQPILNIAMAGKWKQIENVRFCCDKTAIAIHTTHWHAPWNKTSSYNVHYKPNLRHFEVMK